MHICPNCGFEIEEVMEDNCPNCGFNFNQFLNCAYKVSGKCIHNNTDCFIKGLDFESCSIYLKQSGIC